MTTEIENEPDVFTIIIDKGSIHSLTHTVGVNGKIRTLDVGSPITVSAAEKEALTNSNIDFVEVPPVATAVEELGGTGEGEGSPSPDTIPDISIPEGSEQEQIVPANEAIPETAEQPVVDGEVQGETVQDQVIADAQTEQQGDAAEQQ